VKAQIRSIDSYSAHADQTDLLRWIEAREPIEGSLFLSHGETGSIEALRRLAQSKGAAQSIVVPQIGETYALPKAEAAKRTRTGRTDIQEAVSRDWQNDYASFATRLKRELHEIESASARREALARMEDVLRSYRSHGKPRAGQS
jgi:metallo-beta-lactamase family protein